MKRVIDFDDNNNHLAIVMEYLDGQTLDDYVKENGALTKEKAIEIYSFRNKIGGFSKNSTYWTSQIDQNGFVIGCLFSETGFKAHDHYKSNKLNVRCVRDTLGKLR
jgi:serine/threonine protein kinase